jgi:hypothetical protein
VTTVGFGDALGVGAGVGLPVGAGVGVGCELVDGIAGDGDGDTRGAAVHDGVGAGTAGEALAGTGDPPPVHPARTRARVANEIAAEVRCE